MWQAWRPHNQADVDAALTLLLDLSDNYQNQSQINTVFYQNHKSGPGGII
jgi:hypothetical protein